MYIVDIKPVLFTVGTGLTLVAQLSTDMTMHFLHYFMMYIPTHSEKRNNYGGYSMMVHQLQVQKVATLCPGDASSSVSGNQGQLSHQPSYPHKAAGKLLDGMCLTVHAILTGHS